MDLEKIEVLDCSINNWGVWSDKMQNYLLLKHGGGYLLGIIPRPDPSANPSSTANWDLNNLCIIAALHTHSSPEEQKFLHTYSNTYLAWDGLKSRHEKVGPITQILLIQQALAVCYHQFDCLSTTSTQLGELVWRIYAIRLPKESDFLTIMMLNAMSDDLPHVRNHITDALSASSSTNVYGPSNIRARLDVKQQLIDTEKLKGSGDITMVATRKGGQQPQANQSKTCSKCGRAGHSFCCTHCNSWGHYAQDCFAKGGAMEGKRDEVLARKRTAHKATGKGSSGTKPVSKGAASTSKPGGVHYDQGGRAYLLDGETGQAIYIASIPTPSASISTTSTPESHEFAGLMYDPMTPSFIPELSAGDDDEFSALLAAVDTLQTSVDWCQNSQLVDFAGLTYKAPNQHQCSIVDPC
jgi:hypothetical protein